MIEDTRNMEGDNCEALIWSHLGLDLKKKKNQQCYNFPIIFLFLVVGRKKL